MLDKELKSVRLLYGRHNGETIYIVGSGASMRVFPVDFLADKITIGLNMAWKNAPTTYGITIHSDLNIPEFLQGEEGRPDITWITSFDKSKRNLTDKQLSHAVEHFYFFRFEGRAGTAKRGEPSEVGRMLEWVREPVDDHLYIWSSIAQTAVNLAANMGAKNIVLVGCDNCSLMGNHHGHRQHTRWKGAAPDHRYGQYYEGLAEIRSVLRERGVEVLSMTPFLGLNTYNSDFTRLCTELGRETLIREKDISPSPLFNWLKQWRRPVFWGFEVLHLVEQMRTVKRWLKIK